MDESDLWNEGLAFLCSQSGAESTNRKFLGKLVRQYGKANVAEKMRATIDAQAVDAKSYLVACLQNRAGNRPRYRSNLDDNISSLEEWLDARR